MSYILFFDSGIGGFSVLREAIKLHPEENYIFFADEKNLPYGDKSIEKVSELTCSTIAALRQQYKIRAIVISCNTATSAAISKLRREHCDIPVIGIEPAVKPACELCHGGRIGVMATSVTLSGKKFHELCQKNKMNADIIPIPAPGLVELIEKESEDKSELEGYLNKLFCEYGRDFGCIVLGCTHYPFVKDEIMKASGCKNVIDGAKGTVRQLFRMLEYDFEEGGERIFLTSDESISSPADFVKKAERFLSKK